MIMSEDKRVQLSMVSANVGHDNLSHPQLTISLPEQDTPDQMICIKAVCQEDGFEIQFFVKKRTNFKKLMDAYCTLTDQNVETVNFQFNEQQITKNDTISSMKM